MRSRLDRPVQVSQTCVLLVLLSCSTTPAAAVNWGQRLSEFGHAVGEAVVGTADPRLWDIADGGHAPTPSHQLPPSAAVHQSQVQQGQAAEAGSSDQTLTANPAAAADALNEAYIYAEQLIEQAHAAVLDMGMPASAESGFRRALNAFLQAETHLRDWGLAVLRPNLALRSATAGSGAQQSSQGPADVQQQSETFPEQLRQQSIDALHVVVQELHLLIPEEARTGHHTLAAQLAGSSSDLGHPAEPNSVAAAAAAGGGTRSLADDILESLMCLEQLTAGLTAAAASHGDARPAGAMHTGKGGWQMQAGSAWIVVLPVGQGVLC